MEKESLPSKIMLPLNVNDDRCATTRNMLNKKDEHKFHNFSIDFFSRL